MNPAVDQSLSMITYFFESVVLDAETMAALRNRNEAILENFMVNCEIYRDRQREKARDEPTQGGKYKHTYTST